MIVAWFFYVTHMALLLMGAALLFIYRRQGDGFCVSKQMAWPDISIVSSVKGISGGFEEGVAGLWNQNYDGQIEIVIVIEDLDDPAVAHLDKMRSALPANSRRSIKLVRGKKFAGSNPRNRKMLYGFGEAQHEWIFWHAIDTTFDDGYLRACVTLTQNDPNRYVTGFPINHSAQNFGAHLETTCLNLEVSRVFLFSLGQRKRGPVYGGAIFAHRSLFEKCGAMSVISWRLTEDVVFGQAFAKAGAERYLHPWPAYVRQTRQSFKAFLSRQVRWMMIARYHLMPEYLFGLSSFLVPFFLIGAWLSPAHAPTFLMMAASYFALRLTIAFITQVQMKTAPSDWWQVWNLIVYDLLNPVFWFLALVKHEINWAGDVMTIGPGGELKGSKQNQYLV